MFYEAELEFLMKVLRKMHLQVLLLNPENAGEVLGDFGFRKFLGIEEYYEKAFWKSSLWSKDNTVYRLQDEFRCNYVFLTLPRTSAARALLIGPYTSFEMSKEDMMEVAEQFRIPARRFPRMEEYYKTVPVVQNEAPIFSLITAFGEVLWGDSSAFEVVDLNMELTELPTPLPEGEEVRSGEDMMLRMKLMENRYGYENELMEMVAQGQTHRAEAMMAAFSQKNFEQRLSDSLRNLKNYLIICNTLLRKAAEQGGVHPVYLDSASSDFARKIEGVPGVEKGQKLIEDMVRSYSRLVRKHSMRHFSPIVQKAVAYIETGLADDLSLSALARVLNINASYLSSQFRKETGQTVTAYVHEKRMQAGAHLLKTTRLQVQTVAQHCGVSDVNYFSKMFKKRYGMTPKQFRNEGIALLKNK